MIPVADAVTIGAAVTGGTNGSIIFVGTGGVLAQDNANFFWDDTNKILSIGDNTPASIATFGALQVTVPEIAAAIEAIAGFFVAGSAGSFSIVNNTTASNGFSTMLRGIGTAALTAMNLQARGTTDSGTTPIMFIDTRISTASAATVRPLVQFLNGGAGYLIYDAQGRSSLTPSASTSGSALSTTADWALTPGAHTAMTLSTEASVFKINTATRQWATGTITNQRDVMLSGMTYGFVGASTVTNAATLFVDSPTAGTNATLTNNYAVWFQAKAIASAGETVARFDVSDSSNHLVIENSSVTDAVSLMAVRGVGSGTNAALTLTGQGATDSVTTQGVLVLVGRIGTATSVSARLPITFKNLTTILGGFTGDTDGGRLLIGNNTVVYGAASRLLEMNISAASTGVVSNVWSTSASQAAILEGNKSASATIGTHTIVTSTETLAYFRGSGSDGTAFRIAAEMRISVDGTPGASDMPGKIVFATTPDGAAAVTEAVRISSRRNMMLNITGIAEPTTSVGTLVLTNAATAPTTSVDVVSLFSADVAGAGTASLALYTEQAVAADIALASTNSLKVNINGTVYRIPLTTP